MAKKASSDGVYGVIDVTAPYRLVGGCSQEGSGDREQVAARSAPSLKVQLNMKVEGGKVVAYRARVQLSFRVRGLNRARSRPAAPELSRRPPTLARVAHGRSGGVAGRAMPRIPADRSPAARVQAGVFSVRQRPWILAPPTREDGKWSCFRCMACRPVEVIAADHRV